RAGAWLLLAALGAQFLADFAASSIRFRLSRKATLSAQLRDTGVYGLVRARGPLLGVFAVLSRERRERLQSLIELGNAYRGTALVLGDVVEADDGYTGAHSKGVVRLCLEVAELLELSAERRRNLEF